MFGISKYGDSGAQVALIQRRLNVYGARLVVDGKFGANTQAAVKHFQALHHLAPDGIVGPLTWAQLLKPAPIANRKPKPPAVHPVTPPHTTGVPSGSLQIDVSNNDGAINWAKVAADSHHIRSAYAKVTEGKTFIDSYWRNNKSGAISNKIAVGGYHFGHPGSVADGVAQANFFLSYLGQVPEMLRPCIDWEAAGGNVPEQVPTLEAIVQTIYNKVGVYPVIYGGYYFLHAMNIPATSVIAKCPLWIAAYPNVVGVPQPWRTYWSHQYTSSERVDGINGRVDMSKVFVPLDSLIV